MDASDRKLYPLCNIGGMISDTLQIFGNHDQIDRFFSLIAFVVCNCIDQFLFRLFKHDVYSIICFHHTSAQLQILIYIGSNTVADHFCRCF